MFKIIVCIKQVTDPEAPASAYKVDSDTNKIKVSGVPPVMSTFDETALEAALRMKENQECEITVISVGKNLSKNVLMKSLAVGADELMLIETGDLEELDSYATAITLAKAIKKIGEFDLILTGRQAADTNAGAVGPGIATLLDIPCITEVRKIEIRGDKIAAEKVLPYGYQVIESSAPCLATVGNELGELRTATLQQILAAKKKTINSMSIDELEHTDDIIHSMLLQQLFIPQSENICEYVTGETAEEMAIALADKLREVGLV